MIPITEMFVLSPSELLRGDTHGLFNVSKFRYREVQAV